MTRARRRRAITATVIAALASTSSLALAEKTVSVFPLAPTGLPAAHAGLPDALASELARTLRAKLSRTQLEDAALALDCQVETAACLTTITERAGTPTIVFGAVSWNESTRKLKVVLTRYDEPGGKVTGTWVLTSAKPADAVPELITRAQDFLDEIGGRERPGRAAEPDCRRDPDAVGCATTVPLEPDPAPPTAGVTTGTYGLIVGGAVATAVGVGFFVSAQGIRNDVESAPDDTREQIADLIALEDKGKLHATLGYGLMLGGAALATYGIVRALRERKPATSSASAPDPSARELDSSDLSVAPLPGGAALFLSGRFR